MRVKLPSAAQIRKVPTFLHDAQGRHYVALSDNDRRRLALPAGRQWMWCANTTRGAPPTIGTQVYDRSIVRIACGFERTRAVGVVEIR